ncbi:penicillin-binding protein 1A [Sandaracinus amylolyticus]|uniref:Multimodular transpeptidase-transglycosylase n=1 Tax=Sandaracinus amylolyticus TaxID=927083 RepID=A0A0F6YHQ5_9BACT|nr:PBP1A family penicillin-binding protein [Sandaracinus amylolyticus]AKF05326.1 Multimodular transpeptidase-transglycosylase [Sandaracinus amylolyticus]
MTSPKASRDRTSPSLRTRRPLASVREHSRARRGRPGVWRWIGRGLIALLVLVIVAVLGFASVIAYYSRDLPDVASLRTFQEPQVTRVVDRDGALVGEIFTERRTVVPLERVPRVLVLSVLAAEDADFYRHEGLDYAGLFRAVVRGVLDGGNFRGTSTITQQLVKNLLLGPERSWERKIRELILARHVEEELSKDEILGLYLNHINFGHGRYGVQEASQFYFGKDVSELTLAEASLLAGIPQSPTHLSPRTHPEASRRRQRFVLDQLERKREEYWPDLTVEDIRAAREAHVELAPLPESRQSAPEIMDVARRVLTERVGEEAAQRGGYVVHTSVDRELQLATREALRTGLRAIDQRSGMRPPIRRARVRRGERMPEIDRAPELRVGGTYDAVVTSRDDETGTIALEVAGHPATARIADLARWNPEELPPSRFVDEGARLRASIVALAEEGVEGARARARLELGPQGAVVLIDPRSREVLALVGGYEAESGFDRARLAQRQPGSTFKPFVYALGIRSRRYTPASIVIDAPGVYDQWMPQNFETWSFAGEMRLRDALANSVNQVAVRLIEDLTPAEVVSFAQHLGVTSELDPSLALALGASEVRPIELANAYATFAAGGRWAAPRVVTRIVGPDGRDVPLPETEPPRDVLTQAEAYVVTSMLTSVVQSGTAQAAQRLRRPIAGKTGTSNEARDAWFAGYSADLVAVVWVGYDDHRSLGRRESGARAALPIWMEVMRVAEEGRPVIDFPVPSGVVTVRIDPRSGQLAYEGQQDAIDEVFLEGTAPSEVAREAGVLDPSAFLMEQFGGGDAPAPEQVLAP